MIIPVPLSDADVSLTTYIAYSSRNTLPKASTLTIELIRKLYQDIARKMNEDDRKLEQQETVSKHNQYLFY